MLWYSYHAVTYMRYTIVGLGNPGEEYAQTRHNIGRRAVAYFAYMHGVDESSDWKADKVLRAQKAKVTSDIDAVVVLPDTFMNKSGLAVKPLITSEKAAARLVVVYDDMDLPFGTMRIKVGGSSGGHRGVESIIRSIKTKEFIRVRIGIAPTTPMGKIKKPKGEDAVLDFLMSPLSKKEQPVFDGETLKKINEAIEIIAQGDVPRAMNLFN